MIQCLIPPFNMRRPPMRDPLLEEKKVQPLPPNDQEGWFEEGCFSVNRSIPPSQEWFIERMRAMGYADLGIGYCYGLSVLAARAALLGPEALELFNARLQRMCNIPVQDFKEGLANYDSALRTDIHAFFDAMKAFQEAHKHAELFGGHDLHVLSSQDHLDGKATSFAHPCYVYVQPAPPDEKEEDAKEDSLQGELFHIDAEGISTKITSINTYSQALIKKIGNTPYTRLDLHAAKQFGNASQDMIPKDRGELHAAASLLCPDDAGSAVLFEADSFTGAYTLQELEDCFAKLAQHATQSVALVLGSKNHTISVSYDFDKKRWSFTDANQLPTQYIKEDDELAQKILARKIHAAFSSKNEFCLMKIGRMAISRAEPQPFLEGLARWKASVYDEKSLSTDPTKAVRCDSDGASLLSLASIEGHTETVRALLENKGLPPEFIHKINKFHGTRGLPALVSAAIGGHSDIVALLLEKGAEIGQVDTLGNTALHMATYFGHADTVKFLLEKGADVNETNYKTGATALHIAAENGDADLVALLLEKGADVNSEKKKIWVPTKTPEAGMTAELAPRTPLEAAARYGYTDIAKLLLEKGAKNTGDLPPFMAILGGHTEMVTLLWKKGLADESAELLWSAAIRGHADIVRFLLEKGAPMDKGRQGTTPLQIAATHGHLDVVKVLLEKGANPKQTAEFFGGKEPLALAAQKGHTKVVQYFRQFETMKTLDRYIKKESLPNAMCRFFPNSAPPLFSAQESEAIKTLRDLLSSQDKAVDPQVLEPFQQTIHKNDKLRAVYRSACIAFPHVLSAWKPAEEAVAHRKSA